MSHNIQHYYAEMVRKYRINNFLLQISSFLFLSVQFFTNSHFDQKRKNLVIFPFQSNRGPKSEHFVRWRCRDSQGAERERFSLFFNYFYVAPHHLRHVFGCYRDFHQKCDYSVLRDIYEDQRMLIVFQTGK